VRTKSINRSVESSKMTFTYTNSEWKKFLIHKGSVALNGVSLTISDIKESFFSIEIIPHTLNNTNLQYVRVGTRINIELDLIGKYLYNQKW
jgi:riboflavin synthase